MSYLVVESMHIADDSNLNPLTLISILIIEAYALRLITVTFVLYIL